MSNSNGQTYSFGEMVHHISERVHPDDAQVEYYIGLEHLDSESLKIRRWGSPDDVGATKLRFYPGDIIFGKRRFYQRKLAVAEFDGICSAHAMVLRAKPDVVLPEFLPFFLQSETFYERAISISVGSLSPTINWTTLKRQEFALPPLDEQRRIAEILTAVEDVLRRQEEVIASSEDFKRIAMSSIFREGYLELGNGKWKVEKLEEVCEKIVDGAHRTPTYVESGIPFLRVTDIQTKLIDWEKVKYIPPSEHYELIKRCHPEYGDILLSKNGTIGIVKAVDWEREFSVFVSLCLLKPKKCILTDYLLEILQSPRVQSQFENRIKQATVKNLHMEEIRECKIPLPSIETQKEIIAIARNHDSAIESAKEYFNKTKFLKSSLLEKYLNIQH